MAVASLSQYIHDHPEQAENIGMDFVQSVRGVNPYSTVNPDKLEQQLHAYFNSPDAAFLTADDKQLLNVALQGSGNDIVLGDAQANLLMGLAGNDSLNGGAGDDTLDGGTGEDELKGGSGNNEYRFGVGYGYDRIINQNSSGRIDTIKFMGFVFLKDISFGRSNDDLWISIDGTKDVLIVQDHFNSDLTAHSYINLIKFSDGTSFNIDPDHFSSAAPVAPALQNNYGQVRGTSKSDTITVTASVNGATTSAGVSGGAGDDLISGLASNDVLHGDEGNDSLLGNEGQDSLYGGDGNDQLTGGTGDDALYGGAGNDTYIYNLGDGLDFITRQGLASDTSVIEFGAGILAQNIHVQRIGQDLNIVITAGIDEIRVKDFFNETTGAVILENAISALKFSNGDIWNIAKIKTEIIAQAATLGSDTIYGFETNDVLSGGKGLDYIYGGAGDDTYQYNRDDDIDFITDTGGADQITLGAGISQTQVNIDRNSSNSLVLTIQGGGSLVVTGSFDPSSAAFYPGTIESVRFADGKVWDLTRIYWETLKIKGGFANDSITGTSGNDTLVGRTGDDQISGGAGDDYYEYALGDGKDTITDSAGQDIISLGDGITQSQVILTADSAKNLVIALPDGGSITVAGEFNAWGGFTPKTIDYIRFADNSIWGLARIKSEVAKNSAKLLSGTAANDTLVGDIGHDTFVGGKGSDQLEGGGGNDTYRYALGDANDVISELAGNDTIEFQAGITQENVIARSDSKNLTLTMSDGATLTVKDMFAPKASVILDSNVSAVINLMEP
jgi:Ca2+-binding RTX toxin-like protein